MCARAFLLVCTLIVACGVEPTAESDDYSVAAATSSAQILFVSSAMRPPAPDRAVIDHLLGQGHAVQVVAAEDVRGADSASFDVVVIASSVSPNVLGDRLRDVPVPVLLWEQFLYDDMRMASRPRSTSDNARTVRIDAPDHPAAGGLSGAVNISDGSTRLTYATVPASARVIASVGGRANTFVFDTGAEMVDGFVAPGKRIGVGLDYATPSGLTPSGWRLLDGVVAFAVATAPGGSPDAGMVSDAGVDGADAGVADAGGHHHPPGVDLRVGDEPAPTFPAATVPTTYQRVLWADMPPIWTDTGNPASRVGWLNRCGPSARAQIDPIVQPGARVSMHLHDFFSNPHMRFDRIWTYQIVEGVQRERLTCDDDDDFAAYWVPGVRDNGRDWIPEALHVYYKGKVKPSRIEAIPMGLRIVVGDAHARANQPAAIGWWERERTDTSGSLPPNTDGANEMISVGANQRIVLRLNFPDCWDGQHLYKADGSHMAYSQGRYGNARCPESHQIAIPQVQYFVRYPIGMDGGRDFELESGPWYTFHGDFWNAWDPRVMEELVQACIRTRSNCRLSSGTGQVAAAQRPITIGGD